MFHQYLDTESPGEGRGQPLHNLHPWLISSLNQGELRALGLVVHYPLHAGEGGLHRLAVVSSLHYSQSSWFVQTDLNYDKHSRNNNS